MTDEPGTGDDSGGTPRWMPVLGIALAIGLAVLLVVLHLTGVIGPGAH